MGCLQVTFAPNPGSVLWSHLCRSSSVTRSTAMKRTCRKSLQPSKVSQGCLPNCPRKSWLLPQPMAYRTPWPHSSHFSRMPSFPSGFETGVPQEAGAGPFFFLRHWTSGCRPDLALPSVPWLPSVAQVGSYPLHPGPVHSQGPGTQSALCAQSLPLPLPGGASQEPLWRIDICVAAVGQGGRVSAH